MGGAYGYGSSMNAWFHDYLGYWAGHDGFIWHSATQFRSPAFERDVTYVDGEIIDKIEMSPYGMPVLTLQVKMSTQSGAVIIAGEAGWTSVGEGKRVSGLVELGGCGISEKKN